MRAKEELRLVESFGELRAGMIVVGKPCLFCGRAHRGIITAFEECGTSHCWLHEPTPPCAPYPTHISETSVKERRVFRVIDGLENEQSHSISKKTNQPARVR